MTEYSELVKALRERALRENEWYEHGGDIIEDAADAIEALQADIKRLKEVINELREAQTYIDHYGDKWLTSAKDVPTAAYEHGYADGRHEAMAKMEVQDADN